MWRGSLLLVNTVLVLLLLSCNKDNRLDKTEVPQSEEMRIFYEFVNHELNRTRRSLGRTFKKERKKIFLQKIVYFGDSAFERNELPRYYKWRREFDFDQSKMIFFDNTNWLDTTLIKKEDIVLTYKFRSDRARAYEPYLLFTPFYSFDKEKSEFIIGTSGSSWDERYYLISKYRRIAKGKFKLIKEIDGYVAH